MRRRISIAIVAMMLASCTSTTVSDLESRIDDLEDENKKLESIIYDLESRLDDQEYKLEELESITDDHTYRLNDLEW